MTVHDFSRFSPRDILSFEVRILHKFEELNIFDSCNSFAGTNTPPEN